MQKICSLAAIAAALTLSAAPLQADTHRVWAESTAVVVEGETAWRVEIYRRSEGPLQQSTGLGLRVHFDSTSLELIGHEDVLAEGLVGIDAQSRPDSEDLDRTEHTDAYLGLAWGDLLGAWPSSSSSRLATLLFRPVASASGGSELRFSSSALPPGWSLSAAPLRIE